MKNLLIIILLVAFKANCQVSSVSSGPRSVTSTGVLTLDLTKVQMNAIVNPAAGLIVFCKDCNAGRYYVYNTLTWVEIVNTPVIGKLAPSILYNCDNDSFVQPAKPTIIYKDTCWNNGFYDPNQWAEKFEALKDLWDCGVLHVIMKKRYKAALIRYRDLMKED